MKKKVKSFFISYTASDEQWALWIAGTLEKAGYKTIIQKWDFKPGENFVLKMDKALKREMFIAVMSKAYLQSLYCQAEWTAAFTKDPLMEKAQFIPVRIENVKIEGLLAPVIYIDLFGKKGEKAEEELLNGVSTERRPRNRPGFPGTEIVKFPGELPFNNLPENRNPHFTGRQDVIERIYNTFEQKDALALTQAIAGLGGVGKTQVVLEYTYRYGYKYDRIWWINAETEETIFASFQDFAMKNEIIDKEIKDSKIIIEAVRNWMQKHNNWLFVYDNAEEFDSSDGRKLKDYLPQQSAERRHVLITSRSKNWSHLATVINLEVFSLEEASEFLTRRTRLLRCENQDELVKKLGYLSLALEQAGAYICNNGDCDYKEYLILLDEYRLELFEDSPDTITNKSIHATWDISFKKITNESSKELLNLCAFLAPNNIRCEWFTTTSEVLPESLREISSNKLKYNKAIAELTKYSLVDRKDDSLSIHRLVQEVVRDNLKQEQPVWRNYCINILNKLCYDDFSTAESRANFLILAPHIDSVINGINDDDTNEEEVSELYFFSGKGFYELADYHQSLKWYVKELNIYEKVLGKEHLSTANSYNNMALVYMAQGDYKHALEYYGIASNICEKFLGLGHQSTAATYNNMAEVYCAQGNYDHALEYYKKALNICEKVLSKEHPNIATTYDNMAVVYQKQADYEHALEYNKKALYIREKALGNEHPETAETYSNMAVIYRLQADYDQSLEYNKKALNIREKVFGKEHPQTANTYNNMALVYQDKGDNNSALEYSLKTLKICEKTLGKEHPHTATTYNNLAFIYNKKGDYDNALEYYGKALSIKEKVLGLEHPETATIYNNIAFIYEARGDYDSALEWCLKSLLVLESVLDNKHPLTKTAINNIQIIYDKCKKPKPFDVWLKEVIAGYGRD